jgi:hypothetical protein
MHLDLPMTTLTSRKDDVNKCLSRKGIWPKKLIQIPPRLYWLSFWTCLRVRLNALLACLTLEYESTKILQNVGIHLSYDIQSHFKQCEILQLDHISYWDSRPGDLNIVSVWPEWSTAPSNVATLTSGCSQLYSLLTNVYHEEEHEVFGFVHRSL